MKTNSFCGNRSRSLFLFSVLALDVLTAMAQPQLTPLLHGKWPNDARGNGIAVCVTNNLAYIAGTLGGVSIINVSNPAHPVRAGGFQTDGSAQGVAVVGDYAYIADCYSSVQIIDVSNPANPVSVGRYSGVGCFSPTSATRPMI